MIASICIILFLLLAVCLPEKLQKVAIAVIATLITINLVQHRRNFNTRSCKAHLCKMKNYQSILRSLHV